VDPALPEDLTAYGAGKSTVSARFARATGELLPQFLQRLLTTRMLVLYLDAIVLGSHAILVALGVDAEQDDLMMPLTPTHEAPSRAFRIRVPYYLILARAIKWQQDLEAVRQAEKMWQNNASARKLTERTGRRNLP